LSSRQEVQKFEQYRPIATYHQIEE